MSDRSRYYSMPTLTKSEFQLQAKPKLYQVFSKTSLVYACPFRPNIQSRKFIYGYYFELQQSLIDALIQAASSLGDTGCYLSLMSRIDDEPHIDGYIPFSEFSTAYVGTEDTEPLILSCYPFVFLTENALYSPQGKWGIMLDNEGLGVIGGSPEFMTEISQVVPDLDEQVYRFLII